MRLALLALLLLAAPASAHDWYHPWCCNGDDEEGDCQEIPASAVTPVSAGYVISLAPGQHRLVTEPHTWFRKHDAVRWSPDGKYHACLYPTENELRCFYVPPVGF